MTFVRGAVSWCAAVALGGCTLIDLDRLSDASGGSTSTSASNPSATSTTNPSASATSTTNPTSSPTSTSSANPTANASSSTGGCDGPTYCEGSVAQFCDDFDTAASRAAWVENLAVQPDADYELSFVESPSLSCPMSAKTALLDPQPDGTYVQWLRSYDAEEAYDSASLAFSARKEQVPAAGSGIIASLIYGAPGGDFCELLLHDSGDGVGLYVQRIFAAGGATELGSAYAVLVPATLGTWVDHELYFKAELGVIEIEYQVRRENGATVVVFDDDIVDAPCGESPLVSDIHLKLGTNYVGESPTVTFFDDVELELDP